MYSVRKNLILTTTDEYDADFLLQHSNLWQHTVLVHCEKMQKKEQWTQIVAHGVPLDPILLDSPHILCEEIETFNNIIVKGKPRWMLSKANRENLPPN